MDDFKETVELLTSQIEYIKKQEIDPETKIITLTEAEDNRTIGSVLLTARTVIDDFIESLATGQAVDVDWEARQFLLGLLETYLKIFKGE